MERTQPGTFDISVRVAFGVAIGPKGEECSIYSAVLLWISFILYADRYSNHNEVNHEETHNFSIQLQSHVVWMCCHMHMFRMSSFNNQPNRLNSKKLLVAACPLHVTNEQKDTKRRRNLDRTIAFSFQADDGQI